jgi:O-antigen ligase
MTHIYDLTIQRGLLFLIIFTPLALGCIYPWGIALMECVVLCMALAWLFTLLHTGRVRLVCTPFNLPILLFFGLVGLQLLPLPPTVLYWLSPYTYSLYQQTLAGWPDHDPLPLVSRQAVSQQPTSQQTDQSPALFSQGQRLSEESVEGRDDLGVAYTSRWRPLSVYPHATRAALALALTYAVVFLIAVNTLRSWKQLNRLVLTLLSVGGVVAVLGLLQKVSGATKHYWFWESASGAPFGPYMNYDQFASYMTMVLPMGLGYLWGQLLQADQGDRMTGWGWRERLVAVVGARHGWLLLLALALVNMAAVLIFTASRGAIVGFLSALLFFTLLVGWSRRGGHHLALMGLMLAFCVLAYALWLGIDHVWQRFLEIDDGVSGRTAIWSGTLELIDKFPLLGTGLGTYMHGVRRYNVAVGELGHAHNEYLQLLAEAGVGGLLLVVGGLGWFCWRTLQHWFSRHDPEVLGIVLGGLSSGLATGIHSIIDPNFHVPANAFLFSVILALTSVAVHIRQHQGQSVVVFRTSELRLPRRLRLAMHPLALALTLALALGIGKSFAADHKAAQAARLAKEGQDIVALEAVAEQREQVVALAPLAPNNAHYHYQLGQAYDSLMQAQRSSDPVRALVAGVQAMVEYREAILRNPTSNYPYAAWGWALDNARQLATRVAEHRLPIATSDGLGGKYLAYVIAQLTEHPDSAAQWAQHLVQLATYLDPTDAFAHYSAGLYALQQWETLGSEERMRVVQHLRSAVRLAPQTYYASEVIQAVWKRTQDREFVQALARGTSEEARWRSDGGKIAGGR